VVALAGLAVQAGRVVRPAPLHPRPIEEPARPVRVLLQVPVRLEQVQERAPRFEAELVERLLLALEPRALRRAASAIGQTQKKSRKRAEQRPRRHSSASAQQEPF
jgi:hypothetical protein